MEWGDKLVLGKVGLALGRVGLLGELDRGRDGLLAGELVVELERGIEGLLEKPTLETDCVRDTPDLVICELLETVNRGME